MPLCLLSSLGSPSILTKFPAKQCKATQSNAKQCKAMQSNAKQCKATQSNAKQCKAMQSNAKQCKAMQSNAKQHKATQINTKEHKAMQSNTTRQLRALKVIFPDLSAKELGWEAQGTRLSAFPEEPGLGGAWNKTPITLEPS